jgi:hypothetical protein
MLATSFSKCNLLMLFAMFERTTIMMVGSVSRPRRTKYSYSGRRASASATAFASRATGGACKNLPTRFCASVKPMICAGCLLSCIKTLSRSSILAGNLPQLPNKKPMLPTCSPFIAFDSFQALIFSSGKDEWYTGSFCRTTSSECCVSSTLSQSLPPPSAPASLQAPNRFVPPDLTETLP